MAGQCRRDMAGLYLIKFVDVDVLQGGVRAELIHFMMNFGKDPQVVIVLPICSDGLQNIFLLQSIHHLH